MKSKQQLRLEALKRFNILSYTDWSHRQVNIRMKAPEFSEYEAYVERKHAERDALDSRIKKVLGNSKFSTRKQLKETRDE